VSTIQTPWQHPHFLVDSQTLFPSPSSNRQSTPRPPSTSTLSHFFYTLSKIASTLRSNYFLFKPALTLPYILHTLPEPISPPLNRLPHLHPRHEDDDPRYRQNQFPRDGLMFEDTGVQIWNIHGGKNGDGTDDDSPEQELVGPDGLEE
jgi:hypothetical protein